MSIRKPTTSGFKRTSALLQQSIRRASESRGFVQSRVLTHWAEVVGPEVAAISRPVEISYARQGMGATLTLLTIGAHAPMLEMQKEKLRERVNAVYGFNAIARIRITQTAATGFAEGQADFAHGIRQSGSAARPVAKSREAAAEIAAPITDPGLREALERLASNVLSRPQH